MYSITSEGMSNIVDSSVLFASELTSDISLSFLLFL